MRIARFSIRAFASSFLILWGCASSGKLSGGSSGGYVRSVDPFPVLDAVGLAYELPFLGGFNVPRPQLRDIDADGDLDLFIQEESGSIIHLENTGTNGESEFVWRSDRYEDLDVGEWYRMLDLDADGDLDVLAEQRFSHIRYYRNDGGPTEANFSLAVDTLRGVDGAPLFADRQNIPSLTDIDCDGLIDLFIGRITGTITRYESVGMDSVGAPRFEFVTDNFEDIEIIGQMQTRHGANTMAFGDLDADGDEDLLWGDFFEPGLLLIRNLGSCGAPSLNGDPEPFPAKDPVATSGYNAPTIADFDADGDLDVLFGVLGGAFNANFTTIDNLHYLEQVGEEDFAHRSSRFLNTVDIGSESVVKFSDLDGDGDADMLLANKIEPNDQNVSGVYLYENTGSSTGPRFQFRHPLSLLQTYHQNPAMGDLDGDGDLDMLVGTWNREIAYFRNDGTSESAQFSEVDAAYVSLTRGSNSAPALADMDADGDLDLLVGEASGTLNYYRNDGTPLQPNFVLISDEYAGIDVGRRSFPALVDLEGDGDYDLVVGSEVNGVHIFRNTGSPSDPIFEPDGRINVAFPLLATPEFIDIDGDGDLDLFSGSVSGGVVFYESRRR